MGTKVQIENFLAGHCSMRDHSHESNGGSWPSFFGGDDKLPDRQVYHGFLPSSAADSHLWKYDKDVLKQRMLEHEAVFKTQVYELHRLYRVQRDLMDEVKRKDQSENVQSSPYCIKGKNIQGSFRRMLDLRLPADEYVDHFGDVLRSDSYEGKSKCLADLNEPVDVEETATVSSECFLNRTNPSSDVQYAHMFTNYSSSSKNVTQGIHLVKKAAHFLPVFLRGDQLSGDSWKPQSDNVTEQMMVSRLPSQPGFLSNSSGQCGSSWGTPTQKSMSAQTVPFLAPQSNGLLDKKFNLNCSPDANGTFDGETYTENGCHRESAGFDVNRVKDMNLNVVALPNDPLPVLPWLRAKSCCSNKPETSSNGGAQALECSNGRKIHGRKLDFDMNLPCELSDSELDNVSSEKEETGTVDKKMKDESSILRNNFDLNSCITEEEEIPCDTGIDLEAPIVVEDEEAILPIEEFARTAAEAIIAMSSSAELEVVCVAEEADVEDHHPLHWLADIACSSGDCLPKAELDEFESMTLRLNECSFEEYFPKPSFPEFPNIEEGNKHALTRKGPGRRGRQKRDFQRDILPGLTSLSRHEVSEDMQTFGGLMRATGYSSWQCAPNRRKGGRRGRPRAVVAAATVPAPVHTVTKPMIIIKPPELEINGSSLTGWGKTTRRPRRQRLPPAANLTPPPPPPLSPFI